LRPWLQSRRPLRGLENHRVLKTRESFIPHSALATSPYRRRLNARGERRRQARKAARAFILHSAIYILHWRASPCRRRLNARGERRRQARKAARVFILHSAFCILQSTFCIVVRRKGR
jgi:hypothetical protein